MPAASAAVIYFIRTAVISRLPEPGQRQLLSALATAASHAIAPPVIVAAMEGCGVLLELLGACVCVGCHEAAGAAGGPAVPQEPKQWPMLLGATLTFIPHGQGSTSSCVMPNIDACVALCCLVSCLAGEIHDEAAIKAVQNAATSKLSASSTVSAG